MLEKFKNRQMYEIKKKLFKKMSITTNEQFF